MFQSRKEYVDILQKMYEKLSSVEYEIDKVNPWFIVKIQTGFFLHFIFGGKINADKTNSDDIKKNDKFSILKYYINTARIKLKLFFKIKKLSQELNDSLAGKTLYFGSYSHNVSGKEYNPYLHPFYDKDDKGYLLYFDKKAKSNIENLLSALFEYYNYDFKYPFYRNEICNVANETITEFKRNIQKESTILHEDLIFKLNYFVTHSRAFEKFLKVLNPEKIFCYCYYSSLTNSLLYAANALKITTIEYQHSSITDTHFGYAKWKNPDEIFFHFPQIFYVWEETDKNIILNNFSGEKYIPQVEVVGNKYLSHNAEHAEKTKDDVENNILVCLQGQWIPYFLEDFILEDEKYNWYFRLHPRYPQDKEKLLALKAKITDKIFIEEANNNDLYDVFKQVSTLITSFSGTALEAEKFGKKVIIFGEEGYNSYENKIKEQKYAFIDSYSTILKYL